MRILLFALLCITFVSGCNPYQPELEDTRGESPIFYDEYHEGDSISCEAELLDLNTFIEDGSFQIGGSAYVLRARPDYVGISFTGKDRDDYFGRFRTGGFPTTDTLLTFGDTSVAYLGYGKLYGAEAIDGEVYITRINNNRFIISLCDITIKERSGSRTHKLSGRFVND